MWLKLTRHDGSILLIISTLVLQLFLFGPMQVLLNNIGEFSVRFPAAFLFCLVLSLGLIAATWMVVRILKIPVLPAILTFVSVVAFLESRFFLSFAQHQPFNGQLIDWQSIQGLSHVEIGVIAALGLLFLVIHKQLKWLSAISLFILIFVAGGFFFLLSWNTDVVFDSRQAETTESRYYDRFYRLSGERNVIHIVLDQTQGAMLHEILDSDPGHYAEVFDGFTFFTQAMGRYGGTYPSVLYYMAGEAPDPEFDLTLKQAYSWDYIEKTLQERSIVSVLSDNGFNTFGFQFHPGIFCKGPFTACTGTHDEVFAGVPVNNRDRRFRRTVLSLFDVAFFQMSPVVLRRQIFDDGNWFFRKLENNKVSHSGILDLFIRNVRVTDGPASYNYFHHAGAHAPVLFDEDCRFIGLQDTTRESQLAQLNCSLSQIEDLIGVLKDKKIYDQTLIVINGDHGTAWLPPGYPASAGTRIPESLVGSASVLLLVKPPASQGALGFSDKQVTIGDIPATIAGLLGLDHQFDGIPVFDKQFPRLRERDYFTYDEAASVHKLQALPNLQRYRVTGDVFDEKNWQLPSAEANSDAMSELRMDDPEFSEYAEGFSHLEQHAMPVRWVDGKQARVVLEPPGTASMVLVFECYVPENITGQSIKITINGRVVGSLNEEQLKANRHVIPIPDDMPVNDWMDIRFDMGRSLQSGEDVRELSVLFWYVGLQPVG